MGGIIWWGSQDEWELAAWRIFSEVNALAAKEFGMGFVDIIQMGEIEEVKHFLDWEINVPLFPIAS